MLFYLREIMGWVLVFLGLAGMTIVLDLVGRREIVESAVVAGISVMVFRGGIHLIKVATAARLWTYDAVLVRQTANNVTDR